MGPISHCVLWNVLPWRCRPRLHPRRSASFEFGQDAGGDFGIKIAFNVGSHDDTLSVSLWLEVALRDSASPPRLITSARPDLMKSTCATLFVDAPKAWRHDLRTGDRARGYPKKLARFGRGLAPHKLWEIDQTIPMRSSGGWVLRG